jgi:hypothetical protein
MELVDSSSRLGEESSVIERRERSMGRVVILNAEDNLPEIILACGPARDLANVLDCRNQNRDQDSDDANDNQRLEQRDARATSFH